MCSNTIAILYYLVVHCLYVAYVVLPLPVGPMMALTPDLIIPLQKTLRIIIIMYNFANLQKFILCLDLIMSFYNINVYYISNFS